MYKFQEIPEGDPLKEVIKSAFDTEMDISGGWGYTQDIATTIHATELPLEQFEHTFAMMRAYLEMNMTLAKEERFGSINLNETKREEILIDSKYYDKVTYEITAMLELQYNAFIKSYKKGYGQEDFDISEHFNARKEATLHREVEHWFFRDFV